MLGRGRRCSTWRAGRGTRPGWRRRGRDGVGGRPGAGQLSAGTDGRDRGVRRRSAGGLHDGPPFFQYAAAALPTGAGLVDPTVRAVEFTHRFEDADAFWTALLGATVRTSALSDEAQAQGIFVSKLQRWRVGEEYEVPCAAKLGAATRS